MAYHIATFGCQMNKSDSERIAGVLNAAGLAPADDINQADLLVINSCSVRQSAIDRIFGIINNLRKKAAKQKNPKTIKTILTGCVLPAEKKKLAPSFDLVFDIKELARLPEKLRKIGIKTGTPKTDPEFRAFDYADYFQINPQYRSRFSAYVPIMTGCDNFCAYCAVPYTRGREISRNAREIIKEIETAVKKGYKEITLLGQNVNSYRSIGAGGETMDFPQLLKKINALDGDFWIRFLTSHPKDMSDELIKTMAGCPKVCEYVHLPVQSGDDGILRKMNRHYTAAHYLKLIRKIKAAYASRSAAVAISTDIIVGFPGETRKQFGNTARVIKKVGYDMAYIAEYSPRPGTQAAKFADDVSIAEKKRRQKNLNGILKKTALANNKKYEGKTIKILIEKVEDWIATGKTRTFKNVKIALEKKQALPAAILIKAGRFAKIKITQANAWGLEGKIAE